MTACSWFSTENKVRAEKVKLPSPGTTCTGRGTIEIGGDVKLSAHAPDTDANSIQMIKMYFVMV